MTQLNNNRKESLVTKNLFCYIADNIGFMMKLREYLFYNSISVKAFSQIIGCTRVHLSEVIHGRRKAGKRLAKDIERATEGKVTTKEILDLYKESE